MSGSSRIFANLDQPATSTLKITVNVHPCINTNNNEKFLFRLYSYTLAVLQKCAQLLNGYYRIIKRFSYTTSL